MSMSKTKLLCDIYKGSRKEEMYIFVDHNEGLSKVPEALLAKFGELKLVTTLLLTEDKTLARSDAKKVLQDIASTGFFLQMPPTAYPLDDTLAENSKLQRGF